MTVAKNKFATTRYAKALSVAALASSMLSYSAISSAGATFKIDDTKWLSVGAGLRSSFSAVDEAAGKGSNDKWSTSFSLDNIRLYVNGQIHENIKFEFNTECGNCSNGGDLIVLDAIAKFEFTDYLNIWVGRQLVPADRAELNGPFYHSTYEFNKTPFWPQDQGSYTAGKFGRDDGINVWGALTPDKKLTYAVGVFDGTNGASNADDSLLYAGRLSYNFLEVEKNPGYYTSSTYYGNGGDIFTIGVASQYQADGAGSATNPADFFGISIDLLSETILSNNAVVTVEAEYKRFELDGVVPTDGANFGMFEGDAYTSTALYLIPDKVFIGQLQPYVRYTYNDPENSAHRKEYEVGVNYIIDSHNARISLMYQYGDMATKGRSYTTTVTGDEVSAIKLGLQIQI